MLEETPARGLTRRELFLTSVCWICDRDRGLAGERE